MDISSLCGYGYERGLCLGFKVLAIRRKTFMATIVEPKKNLKPE